MCARKDLRTRTFWTTCQSRRSPPPPPPKPRRTAAGVFLRISADLLRCARDVKLHNPAQFQRARTTRQLDFSLACNVFNRITVFERSSSGYFIMGLCVYLYALAHAWKIGIQTDQSVKRLPLHNNAININAVCSAAKTTISAQICSTTLNGFIACVSLCCFLSLETIKM